ncbi:MAG: hypothetical protein HFE63_08310 [Clostridiales bacterium]|nr:hypothetical protein [Clostridiales bacterium]
MMLGTVSHELICSTNDIDSEFSAKLQEIASWEAVDKPNCGIDSVNIDSKEYKHYLRTKTIHRRNL